MELEGNALLIEASDYPDTLERILRDSVGFFYKEKPAIADNWHHRAQNAWETITSGFCIVNEQIYKENGGARIFLSIEDLEIATIAYGCELQESSLEAELIKVDSILKSIDRAKASRKQ